MTCTLTSVPQGEGWIRVPNTPFTPHCQQFQSAFGFDRDCRSIFTAWSGGIGDVARNRLVIFGGGHNDYYGNEVYAFSLATMGYEALNAPTPLTAPHDCIETLSDGRPSTRHTYGGLAYNSSVDKMVLFGGAVACEAGGIVDDIWELDLQGLADDAASYWTQITGEVPDLNYGGILAASDYDPVTQLVYVYNSSGQLFSYDSATRTTEILGNPNLGGYHYTAVVDAENRRLLIAGDDRIGTFALDGDHSFTDLSATFAACAPLGSAPYPGLAYDAKTKTVVGWAGGANVYSIDLAANTCTVYAAPGDPPGPQLQNGTHGRFRYFPAIEGFVLAHDPDDDVRILKFAP
jgi:hypothetical protein